MSVGPGTVSDVPKPRLQLPTRVVAAGAGVSVRTRLRLDPDERLLLEAVGAHLTRARNTDLAAARRGEKANDRYKVLVEQFAIHSRYAGTICVDNDAATKAAKEHLWRHRAGLRRAIATLERRTAAPARSVCGCGERRGCPMCRDGYATINERFQKQRRLASLTAELARVEGQLAAKDYPVVYGGRRLAGTRYHLAEAGAHRGRVAPVVDRGPVLVRMRRQRWQARWQPVPDADPRRRRPVVSHRFGTATGRRAARHVHPRPASPPGRAVPPQPRTRGAPRGAPSGAARHRTRHRQARSVAHLPARLLGPSHTDPR